MITCEWGDVCYPHNPTKKCLKEAKYVLVFKSGHPAIMPFENHNFVCEDHLKHLRKLGFKMEVYEFIGLREKVQFT